MSRTVFMRVDKKNTGRNMHHFVHGFSVLVIVWIFTRTTFCQVTNVTRLVNGLTLVEGRVEVLIDGTWGTVCDKNWDYNDALVVCRSLGFTGALGTTSLAEFGLSYGVMPSYDFQCNGTESDILECLRDEPQCSSPFREAGVRCSDCQDVNPKCPSWASNGACESYPGEVIPVCQYSCDQCNTIAINDSVSSLPQNETCITGHCYLDSNNGSHCKPVVDICVAAGWYQGMVCIATPIRPIPSSIRCMTSDVGAQTNLTPDQVDALISALTDKLSGLEYTTAAVEQDIALVIAKFHGLLTKYGYQPLQPQHIYDRQRQATSLILLGYEIQHVEDNAFTAFTSLRTLVLGSNNLRKIRKAAFTGLRQLQYLNFRDNKISSIENDTFTDMTNLFFLELNENSFVHLQPGVFSGLINLRDLALIDNKIRGVKVGVFDGLQNLQFLHLQSNNISWIQVGAFSQLENLRILICHRIPFSI
ncbi:leucine-rich repeat-containing protein 4 isoform X1 [Strongylocentrotus purpuratus]|uniref:SRCR domain-containing protein n=2 Tax=Strongylocentrotus purpuratus TaxID=7668 RepID=A0A7M7PCC2_STRPU|nr:leucine-rich repeat-containing protein 4 isoform X1 [Strongylocentrotus purpuratus]